MLWRKHGKDKEWEIVVAKTWSTGPWSWDHHSRDRQPMATHRDRAKRTNTLTSLFPFSDILWVFLFGPNSWKLEAKKVHRDALRDALRDGGMLGSQLRGFGGVCGRQLTHLDIHLLVYWVGPIIRVSFMTGKAMYILLNIIATLSREWILNICRMNKGLCDNFLFLNTPMPPGISCVCDTGWLGWTRCRMGCFWLMTGIHPYNTSKICMSWYAWRCWEDPTGRKRGRTQKDRQSVQQT